MEYSAIPHLSLESSTRDYTDTGAMQLTNRTSCLQPHKPRLPYCPVRSSWSILLTRRHFLVVLGHQLPSSIEDGGLAICQSTFPVSLARPSSAIDCGIFLRPISTHVVQSEIRLRDIGSRHRARNFFSEICKSTRNWPDISLVVLARTTHLMAACPTCSHRCL